MDHNKSKKTSSYLSSYEITGYPFYKSIGYYMCLFMQAQFQLGSYTHACTNKAHSLRFNPYFGSNQDSR